MRVLWLTALVVVIDQATKQLVLRTMYLGQQIPILGDWLKFTYTENPGMAFGITFGPKAMVTIFAIIATVLISIYLYRVRRDYLPYRASLALILGGALGNIIDRVFYGKLYDNDTLFVGKVVDFIHVNVWSGFIPEAVPMIGGTYVSLFPIWNVADMAIVCGVVGIIAFQKVHHRQLEERAAAQRAAEGQHSEPGSSVPPAKPSNPTSSSGREGGAADGSTTEDPDTDSTKETPAAASEENRADEAPMRPSEPLEPEEPATTPPREHPPG